MSRPEDVLFDQIHDSIVKAMETQPNTIEARCAFISAALLLAYGLASEEPEPVKRHWATSFYGYADKLAGNG